MIIKNIHKRICTISAYFLVYYVIYTKHLLTDILVLIYEKVVICWKTKSKTH